MIHQNIVLDGKDFGESKGRKYSRFYNEGKWENFILPQLPKDPSEMTFIEFGCSGGLFLRLAKDYGFKKVVGYEMDKESADVAQKYVPEATINNVALDESFDINSVPAADVLLMSNFHYHVHIPALLDFVNRIRRKVRYVIIVSARVRVTRHRMASDIETTRKLFRQWEEVNYIPPIPKDGDPRPRTDMYSVKFKSEIVRKPLDWVVSKMGKQGTHHYKTACSMVDKGARFDFNMPIIIHEQGRIIDGTHRLVCREKEGYKTILTEIV